MPSALLFSGFRAGDERRQARRPGWNHRWADEHCPDVAVDRSGCIGWEGAPTRATRERAATGAAGPRDQAGGQADLVVDEHEQIAVFTLVYLGFAVASSSWMVWPLFIVYGVYIAATEGVARAWVADHAPAGASGTAYGLFAAATGASLLIASIVAGLLWSHVSPSAPFVLGAVSAGLALLLLTGRRLATGSA